jgi:hypothetical protein
MFFTAPGSVRLEDDPVLTDAAFHRGGFRTRESQSTSRPRVAIYTRSAIDNLGSSAEQEQRRQAVAAEHFPAASIEDRVFTDVGCSDLSLSARTSISRRRFQKGSVFQNKTRTMWLGAYSEYVLDAHGVEKRIRRQVVLCPAKSGERPIGKREAQRLLHPHLDRVNSSIASPASERKSATFEAFAEVWERDYLSLSKPSTRSGEKSTLKRLKTAFGRKDMRAIDAGDIQRYIASAMNEGLDPKTIRNHWGTVSLIWNAALAQRIVDSVLPKPKLPRRSKKKAKFLTLSEVARIIAASPGEHRAFYWLAAETGLRAGELGGLKLTDFEGERLRCRQQLHVSTGERIRHSRIP